MTLRKKVNIGWLRWAGHVVRMVDQDCVKRLFFYDAEGKRKMG